MNERLTELYRSCRSKEALASQDEYKSADVLIGTEVAKFAELIVKECIRVPYAMWDRAELNADIAVKIEHRIRDHFEMEV